MSNSLISGLGGLDGTIGGLLGGNASGSSDAGGLLGGNSPGLGDVGGLLGGNSPGSGDAGGLLGGILGVPPTADPEHLLNGLTMTDLLGLNLSLLGNDLLGTGLSLDGQSLTLPSGVDLGGILGTDQADTVNLGAATHLGSAVLGAGDDTLLAPVTSTATGILDAGDGNDTVTIGTGNAELRGGAGNDTLTALGTGDNRIDGGTGADHMTGGRGDDTYIVDNAGDTVVERANQGTDIVLSSVSYTLHGYVENMTLTGHEAITGTGNTLANHLIGNDAANVLRGFGGDDTLDGGAGNDKLIGGVGQDYMTGGAGADRFVFNAGDFGGRVMSAADVITDFSHADKDKIDLSSIDADMSKAGMQHFKFIGDHAFTGAGEIRVDHVGSDLYLVGTLGTNPNGDFKIHLDHVPDITAADLII